MDYRTLVLNLLEEEKYPVLRDYVLLDVYHKTIPPESASASARRYDRLIVNPEDVYARDAKPFRLHYLSPIDDRQFCVHYVDDLDETLFPLECRTIKLNRSFLDRFVLHTRRVSFEEEIYRFLTLLNFDVPRVASLLDLTFFESTRFLPQRVRLFAERYAEQPVVRRPLCETDRSSFGPPESTGAIPVRTLSGRLSECTSRSAILSLNDHSRFPERPPPYLYHYSEACGAVFPLAFNPLENPIVTLYQVPSGSR